MPAARTDPFNACNFLVEIEGLTAMGFAEVTGLGVEIVPIEYREGSDPITVRKLPGLRKYSNIVLKRGYTSDASLWNWMNQVLDGNLARKSLAIVLLDEQNNAVLRWNVSAAWPCKYEGPTLDAKGHAVAIETLEICHEGFELAA